MKMLLKKTPISSPFFQLIFNPQNQSKTKLEKSCNIFASSLFGLFLHLQKKNQKNPQRTSESLWNQTDL